MSKLKKLGKLTGLVIFLYILIFSSQNFWQGYHDVDLSFNFLNLGYGSDKGTDEQVHLLKTTYLRGLNQMSDSFVWFGLDMLLGVLIGYLWRSENRYEVIKR